MTVAFDEKRAWVRRFFQNTGSTYDAVVKRFTLGIDRLWKKKMIARMGAPERILDLACGTGILTFAMHRRFPKSKIVGVDITRGYLAVARAKAEGEKTENILFIESPAEDFAARGTFDVVTTSYLPKYADLARLVPRIHALLAPGGRLVFHDFTYPTSRLLQWLFETYFVGIQAIGARYYPEWKDVLEELPGVIKKTQWVAELTGAMEAAGFVEIRVESLTLQGSALVCGKKRKNGDRAESHPGGPGTGA